MSFRLRLILAFALVSTTAIIALAAVTVAHSLRSFHEDDARIAAGVTAQIQRQLEARGTLLARDARSIAHSDAVVRIAASTDDLAHSHDAGAIARSAQTDFLELLRPDGTIISSAHWPARYGYREEGLWPAPAGAFVSPVETPSGEVLALLAAQSVTVGDSTVVVVTGSDLKGVLSELGSADDVRLWIYQRGGSVMAASPSSDAASPAAELLDRHLAADPVTPFTDQVRTYVLLPLDSSRGVTTAYVVIGRSLRAQRAFVHNLALSALAAIAIALVISVFLGMLIARRITRPVEQLAAAADNVAAGHWQQHVDVRSQDEIGRLAGSFNAMTAELSTQRERLLQAERVAAWRELARRLAHELKNPLFPLQLTLESLVKAREVRSPDLDEIFTESTRTLQDEIDNLKTIVERFSDFSRMPAPEIQSIPMEPIVKAVAQLHAAQLKRPAGEIRLVMDFAPGLPNAAADPTLIRRAIENLTLNAMDAMPNGGELTLRTHAEGVSVVVEVGDTGEGLTPEECDRLFTPYYTTKKFGTGLGLAIVQSIVSDHHGRISVQSEKGKGSTFRIELPAAAAQAASQ